MGCMVFFSREDEKVRISIQNMTATGVLMLALAGPAWAQSAKDLVPQDIKDKGEVTVAMVLDYAPYAFIDQATGAPTGVETDLGLAIGEKLGLKWNIVNVKYEGMLTGVGTGRYDVGAGGGSDLLERQKIVTYVDVSTQSDAVIILAANKDKYPDVASLCGLSLGVLKGTTSAAVGESIAKDCTDAGKAAPTVNYYNSVADSDLALQSGRDNATVNGNERALFMLSQASQPWIVLQGGYGAIPGGPFTAPTRRDFAEAMLAAVKELQAEGKLKEIYAKYGLDSTLLAEPGINTGKQ